MNRWRLLVMGISLLLGTTVAPVVSSVTFLAARAEAANPTLSEQLFRVEWVGGASPPDQFRIVGYVYNEYGKDAVNVQLRISEVDASGRTVGSVTKPVGDTVPASGRAFFDVQVPGTTPYYRVAVESFGFMILEHAPWFLFAWVFCNQAGIPVPVIPALVGAGALAGNGHLGMAVIVGIAVGASLAADLTWYGLGRWRGARALKILSRLAPTAGMTTDRRNYGGPTPATSLHAEQRH